MGAPAASTTGKKWYLHLNGQNAGPFSLEDLKGKIKDGSLTAFTPVWTEGMAGWEKAQNVGETQGLFGGGPPAGPQKGAHESNELSALIDMRSAISFSEKPASRSRSVAASRGVRRTSRGAGGGAGQSSTRIERWIRIASCWNR